MTSLNSNGWVPVSCKELCAISEVLGTPQRTLASLGPPPLLRWSNEGFYLRRIQSPGVMDKLSRAPNSRIPVTTDKSRCGVSGVHPCGETSGAWMVCLTAHRKPETCLLRTGLHNKVCPHLQMGISTKSTAANTGQDLGVVIRWLVKSIDPSIWQ